MVAYIIAPALAFVSGIIIFLPSEITLLVLANMNKAPIHAFGRTLDLTRYGTDFPWLLPVVMAIGSNAGSILYYFMGTGTMRMNEKLKKKIESFDFKRFDRARDAVVFLASVTSLPPVSATAVASGMSRMNFWRYFYISYAGKVVRYYIVLILGHFAISVALKWFT